MKNLDDTAFVFIVQRGQLEIMGCLLAASIRDVYGDRAQLIAAMPAPSSIWGEISEGSLSLLRNLKVDFRRISNPFGKDYPIANKINALGVHHDKEFTTFLDSDMLLLTAPEPNSIIGSDEHTVYMVPADKVTPGLNDEIWEKIYRTFEMRLPRRYIITTVTNEETLPYFNAGLIVVRDNKAFSRKWMETAQIIDSEPEIDQKFKRPWLDQLALPITISLLGLNWKCLPTSWNYPGHLRNINSETVHFYHYHRPDRLLIEKPVRLKVAEIARQHKEIRRITRKDALWYIVLHPTNPLIRSVVSGYYENRRRLGRIFRIL